ncbi:hypothetical protein AB0L25_32580 [Spirillospora sp. NPDC052242]
MDMPDALLDAILGHADRSLRKALTFNLSLGPERRSRLADDPDPGVRGNLVEQCGFRGGWTAERLPLTVHAYEKLAADPDVRIREEVAIQPFTPEHVRARLAGDPNPSVRSRLTFRWELLAGEVRDALLNDPDENVRAEAHKAADILPRSLAESLVRDGDARKRAAAAANASLPADLVDELAVDSDPAVRLAVSRRPGLTERERAAIDYHDDPNARFRPLDWVRALCDDVRAMRECAASAHPALRRSAACCPHLPDDVVARLADDEDPLVRLFLAENHPDPPGSLLLWSVLEYESYTVDDMPRHPNFPRVALRYFADSPDARLRSFVAMDPDASPEVVERLSHDDDMRVRRAMARSPRLPLGRLLVLLDEPGTAASAAANPALPVEVMERMVDG